MELSVGPANQFGPEHADALVQAAGDLLAPHPRRQAIQYHFH